MPGGTRNNLEYVSAHVTFDAAVSEPHRLLLGMILYKYRKLALFMCANAVCMRGHCVRISACAYALVHVSCAIAFATFLPLYFL